MSEQGQPTSSDSRAEATPLLEVRGLCKSFWLDQRRIDVLQGLDLTVYEGEMVAIVGASGEGKSTLLHLLGTLDSPSAGSLHMGGRDVLAMKEEEVALLRNRELGFVFQAHYLLPEFSALENVMMPALIQRMDRDEAEARARELLEWVGLVHRLEHRPGELSGGERQRTALCRALVLRPRLLLADEPTGNLDQTTGSGIHTLLEELNQRWQTTLIVVTHNQTLARKHQRCLRLVDGKLTEVSFPGEDSVER